MVESNDIVETQPDQTGPDDQAWRQALLAGFELGNRYQLLSRNDGNRGLNGTRFRQSAGSSMEFLEHREYQPGDDLRHINWSLMANRDQVYVKCFEQESTPILDLVLDHTHSMNLVDSQKAAGTLKLLAAIYTAAVSAHFHVKIWLAGGQISSIQNRDTGHPNGCHLFQVPSAHPASWTCPDFSATQNLADAFVEQAPTFRPNGYRILISDLLFDADPLPIVQQLAQNSQACLIVQMLSEQDISLPEHGSFKIVDAESNEIKSVFIDAEMRIRYKQSFERHQSKWQTSASRQGCIFVPLIAEQLMENENLKELELVQVLAATGT